MPFEPLTAREGLLEIRRLLSRTLPADYGLAIKRLDAVAEASLDRTAPPNFELTDQLADRLAEAHKLLREIRDRGIATQEDDVSDTLEAADFADEISPVLALPPDLEAMVERRIG